VVQIKAAQVTDTGSASAFKAEIDRFKAGVTLRFPRFQRLREDKDWKSALSREGTELHGKLT